MSILWKLFASYLVVIVVGAAVLIASTLSIAPVSFSQHLGNMRGAMNRSMGGGMMMADLEADLNENFRDAVNSALLMATIAATSAAAIVSAYVSYRITRPLRATVAASQRIASGDYGGRLDVYSSDELGRLTAGFNRMAASLEQIETTRQRLIADISHELKTPLASIQAYMEGLQDGIISPTAETFEQVQRETGRLQRLVHDLQDLSRVESAQIPLQIEPQDVRALVQSAVEWIQPQFEDKQVKLLIDIPEAPLEVKADYDRLRQVMLNVLGNALQYTPSGGAVSVGCERSKQDVTIQVRDTGIGLSEAEIERIFERFYRVDKSRSRASGGSGIGLTIARHIVQAHGGQVWAESAGPGQGSTFHIRLPLAHGTAPTS